MINQEWIPFQDQPQPDDEERKRREWHAKIERAKEQARIRVDALQSLIELWYPDKTEEEREVIMKKVFFVLHGLNLDGSGFVAER